VLLLTVICMEFTIISRIVNEASRAASPCPEGAGEIFVLREFSSRCAHTLIARSTGHAFGYIEQLAFFASF